MRLHLWKDVLSETRFHCETHTMWFRTRLHHAWVFCAGRSVQQDQSCDFYFISFLRGCVQLVTWSSRTQALFMSFLCFKLGSFCRALETAQKPKCVHVYILELMLQVFVFEQVRNIKKVCIRSHHTWNHIWHARPIIHFFGSRHSPIYKYTYCALVCVYACACEWGLYYLYQDKTEAITTSKKKPKKSENHVTRFPLASHGFDHTFTAYFSRISPK